MNATAARRRSARSKNRRQLSTPTSVAIANDLRCVISVHGSYTRRLFDYEFISRPTAMVAIWNKGDPSIHISDIENVELIFRDGLVLIPQNSWSP